MTDALDPGYELQGRVVAILREDAGLQTLLFSTRPAVAAHDLRVYQDDVELPDDVVRETLPRIVVAVVQTPWDTEQSSDGYLPSARCSVTLHALVEASERGLGEALSARIRVVMATAVLSDASVAISPPIPEGTRRPVREVSFRNAWRFTSQYAVPLVSVLR